MRLVINSAATEALDHFSKEGTWSRAGHEYRADRWRERMGNPQQFRQVPQTNAPAKAAALQSVREGAADRATKHIMDFKRGSAQNRAAGWNRELGQTFGSVSQSKAPARAAAEASERQTALRAAAQKRAAGWKSEFAAKQMDQSKAPARAAAQASADQTAAAAAAKAKADAAEKVRLKTNWDEAAAKRAANKPPPRGAPKPSGPLTVGVTAEGRKLQDAHTRAGIWRNTLANDSNAAKKAAKLRKLGKVGAAAGTAAAALGTAAAVPKILASRGAAKAAAAKAAKVKQIKTAGAVGGGLLGANYLMNKSDESLSLVEIAKGLPSALRSGDAVSSYARNRIAANAAGRKAGQGIARHDQAMDDLITTQRAHFKANPKWSRQSLDEANRPQLKRVDAATSQAAADFTAGRKAKMDARTYLARRTKQKPPRNPMYTRRGSRFLEQKGDRRGRHVMVRE